MFAYCRNNPVMHSDPDGNWVVDAVFLAVDIANFVKHPTMGNAGFILLSASCFVDPTGASSAALHTLKTAHFASAIMASSIKVRKIKNVAHSVYTLHDPITQEVKYVGRTSNLKLRKAAHKLSPDKRHLVLKEAKSGLTYSQARGAEQILFEKYGGFTNLLNKIKPISDANPNRGGYLESAQSLLK